MGPAHHSHSKRHFKITRITIARCQSAALAALHIQLGDGQAEPMRHAYREALQVSTAGRFRH